MKRVTILVLILGLVFGAVATAEAGKKKKKKPHVRVFEGTYDNPAPGIGGVLTFSGAGGSVESGTLPNESYVSVEIVDATGTDVYFGLSQEDTDGDGIGEIVAGGCGKTAEPIAITPGLSHTVTVTMGPGSESPSCAGLATQGAIKLTFTDRP